MSVYILGQHKMVRTSRFLIWAENGRVKMEDKETGAFRSWTPDEAAVRFKASTNDLYGNSRSRRALEKEGLRMLADDFDLPNKLVAIVQQAREQAYARGEDPGLKLWEPDHYEDPFPKRTASIIVP